MINLGPTSDRQRVEVVVGDNFLHGQVMPGGYWQVGLLNTEPGGGGFERKLEIAKDLLHVPGHLGLRDGLQGGGDVLRQPDVLEDDPEGFAHHKRIGMKVKKARSLVTNQGHFGLPDVPTGEADIDCSPEASLGLLPVEVVVDELHLPAQLPQGGGHEVGPHQAVARDHLARLFLRTGPENKAGAPLLGQERSQAAVTDGGLDTENHRAALT